MALSDLPRLYRTTRHLRWSQLAARARLTFQRRLASPGSGGRSAPDPSPDGLSLPPCPQHSAPQGETLVESLLRGELRLLNQTLPFGANCWDWRLGAVSQDRLWVVTLHYHQWLYELARAAGGGDGLSSRALRLFETALDHWLTNCHLAAPGAAALAWNSYAIATRLSWSIRAWCQLDFADVAVDPSLLVRWKDSLYLQADHLHRHLEWDLRANHLLRDAVGLAWAGRFFTDDRGTLWLRSAQRIARQQVAEQVLPDGGHFERSPFYHLEVMDDWLALAILLPDGNARELLAQTWRRSAEYCRWLRHPDGAVAQFNDGAASDASHGLQQGRAIDQNVDLALPAGGQHFADSGMVVWHGERWSLFWDVGAVGADVQPGHAHADTLALECSLAKKRLFVDPGCHSYDHDDRRRYDRSTAAHNTLCVDEQDSTEVWHIFRVGHRARPQDISVRFEPDGLCASAAHDGYRRLAGHPTHRRNVRLHDEQGLQICDRVEGAGEHHVRCNWLVGPQWKVSADGEGWWIRSGSTEVRMRIQCAQPLQFHTSQAAYHPDYGVVQDAGQIGWCVRARLPLEIVTTVEEV